ncbi:MULTISPECIES: DUF4199 domain-containing protein [Chitinophagaceae]
MEQKQTSHIIKGVIIGLILIVYSTALYLMGQMMNKGLGYISYIILIIGLIISGNVYSKENNANVTFGNVFAHCFKTNIIVTLLVIVWSVLSLKLIFPNMENEMLDLTRKELEKAGTYSDDQISQSLTFMKKGFMVFMIGGAILGYAILGAIGSLIAAAVAKKNPQQPFTQQG